MLHRVFPALFIGMGLLCLPDSVSAQFGDSSNVSGSAQVRFQAKPSKLRLQVQLNAHGATPESAIKNLKLQRDTVGKQLSELRVDPKSISFSVPNVVPIVPGSRPTAPGAGIPVMVHPGRPTRSEPAAAVRHSSETDRAAPARPRLFVASTTLRADWPLTGDDTDAIVAAAATIREKILAADLTAKKPAQDLSAEEQELVEESAIAPHQQGSSGFAMQVLSDGKAGVAFVYVAVVSDEQRKKLMANGFAQAKKEAEELAEAAGRRLGELSHVYCQMENHSTVGRNYGPEYAGSVLVSSDEHETVGETPEKLVFECEVTVSYKFAAPKEKP